MDLFKTGLLLMMSVQVFSASTASTKSYTRVGCFADTGNRAIPTLEGKNAILDNHYRNRKNPIEKCAKAAIEAGDTVFAVQNGGWCAAGNNKDYDKYGPSKACLADGEGGPWANEVYTLQDYIKIGCYKDSEDRAMTSLEGTDPILDGNYWERKNPFGKCIEAARRGGFIYFALQHGGWCAASNTDRYDRYGESQDCKDDGMGGSWANQVYKMKGGVTKCKRDSCKNNGICANDGESSFVCRCPKGFTGDTCEAGYTRVGCFADTGNRAIPTLEGKNAILDNHYRNRKNPIEKCAKAAIEAGDTVFAVQHGGWCAAGNNKDYDKYGPSKACLADGEGGPWANEVYTLQDYIKIGCYKDSEDRAMTSLEGTDPILDGNYWERKNPFGKCIEAARRSGFIYFALQHGGWCAASNTDRYDRYGESQDCKDDGMGGSWANQVYKMKGGVTKCKRDSCKNNGICANDGESSFVCRCPKGFTGDTCEAAYTQLGCFKDTGNRAIPTMEGKDPILDKQYWIRENPIEKCAKAAYKVGYTIFAVQNGGWCAAGANPDYDKYGPSNACQPDGEGGPWANEVYLLVVSKDPCKLKPCKNGGTCSEDEETSFSCRCKPGFVGRTCEKELPSPCSPNPCKNGGSCEVRGNRYSCRCKPEFGGPTCEYGQATCVASGDPHYLTFDGMRYNFMGVCPYVFAKDCKGENQFTVMQKNALCGWGAATCTRDVTVFLHKTSPQYRIQWTRGARVVVINGERYTTFPIKRPGFVMSNPSTLATDFGLTVTWNFQFDVKVTVSGKYKNKMCGMCGDFNGNAHNDWPIAGLKCELPPQGCFPSEKKRLIMEKCDVMSDKSSPFAACHSTVDPVNIIKNCKYDTCRCEDPERCLCDAVATYTGKCAAHGKIIDWRFKESNLYEPLDHCERTCENPGEVFTECGSSCVKTCRDLSRDIVCNEKCLPGCQCPNGQVLNEENNCVPREECSCEYEGKTYGPGESVSVGECKTCTCNMGAMSCVEDRDCDKEGPCDSQPCKNDGRCTAEGDEFTCECTEEYEGETCEDLVPKPCDTMPCENDGICTNEEDDFSCECTEYYSGPTCETPKPRPCDSSPCKNDAICHDEGNSFYCECVNGFTGETCEKPKEPCETKPCASNPCKDGAVCENEGDTYSCKEVECKTSKLDLLYVVDGSGSVRKSNFIKVKNFINKLNTRFDIGQDQTRLGFIQFGKPNDIQLAFNLGDISNLEEADEAISEIKYKRYQTATGAALKKAREEVFNDNEAQSGDRPDVQDVLILFTDGAATDKPKSLQLTEAAKLKAEGVKIITIGMGTRYKRDKLEEIASKNEETNQPLFFESSFDDIDSLINFLVSSSCE